MALRCTRTSRSPPKPPSREPALGSGRSLGGPRSPGQRDGQADGQGGRALPPPLPTSAPSSPPTRTQCAAGAPGRPGPRGPEGVVVAGARLPALAGLGGCVPPRMEGGARARLGAHGRAHQRARAAGTRLLPAGAGATGRAPGRDASRHARASIKGFVVTAPPSRGLGNQVRDGVPRGPSG
uniref:cuticle collagen 7-like n=1 Tax=Panthera onca TaxID=9690 RepID=UPI0029541D70|nr:cuticle collagen 7-like [Panthera onca]